MRQAACPAGGRAATSARCWTKRSCVRPRLGSCRVRNGRARQLVAEFRTVRTETPSRRDLPRSRGAPGRSMSYHLNSAFFPPKKEQRKSNKKAQFYFTVGILKPR